MSPRCHDCNHEDTHHRDGTGMCTAPGCRCNLFLKQPRRMVHDPLKPAPTQHVPQEFIDAMNKVMEAGVKDGRKAGDWQVLSRVAALRKVKNLVVHLAHREFDSVACNALILWWHFQRKRT